MKYIVVHAGRRDDYQVALALAESGGLHCLVTDFYAPFDSFGWRFLLKAVPNKFQLVLNKRYKVGLSSTLVVQSKSAIFYAFLHAITKKIKFSALKDKALGDKGRRLSIRNNVPIISMNTYAKYAFSNNTIEPKILFQFHPHTTFVKNILTKEMEINPVSRTSLLQEYEFSVANDVLVELAKEIHLATSIICASSITAQSLQGEGISSNNIKVIPYGVETNLYPYKKRESLKANEVFQVIFIGSLNQRKGITYLLEALEGIPNVVLHIVGRGIFDENLLNNYQTTLELHKNISKEELVSLLHRCHCFVLPSLVEGFGQVILEAMATGIPIIASENTIAKDIIQDGVNGFVVPIRNAVAIKNKIDQLIGQPDLVAIIGANGYTTAQNLNWPTFRKNLVAHLNKLS